MRGGDDSSAERPGKKKAQGPAECAETRRRLEEVDPGMEPTLRAGSN